jgi:hypothetical protein
LEYSLQHDLPEALGSRPHFEQLYLFVSILSFNYILNLLIINIINIILNKMDELQAQNHPDVFNKCHKVVSCYILPILALFLLATLTVTIAIKFTLEKDRPHYPKSSNTPIPFEPTLAPPASYNPNSTNTPIPYKNKCIKEKHH